MIPCPPHLSATVSDFLQIVRVSLQPGRRFVLAFLLPFFTSRFSAVILVLQGGVAGIENACPHKSFCPIHCTINSFDFLQSVGLSLPNGSSRGLDFGGRYFEFEAV